MGAIGECCCYICRDTRCEVGADIPLGGKKVNFQTAIGSCNALSTGEVDGSFSRTYGECCSVANIAVDASYVSPTYNGSTLFVDGGSNHIKYCCPPNLIPQGYFDFESHLLFYFAYRFRLRICSIDLNVCQTVNSYGVCGLSVTARATYKWKLVGNSAQYCETKITGHLDFTVRSCSGGTITTDPGGDINAFYNNCCGTSILTGGGGPTDFTPVPPPEELTEPVMECTEATSTASAFWIERTAFIPGATSLPSTPIIFTPSGQSAFWVSGGTSPLFAWYSTQPTYGLGTQSVTSSGICGDYCNNNYMNHLFDIYGCNPVYGQCIEGRTRSETHVRSIPVGDCFFNPMGDTWEISINDPV